MTPAPLAIVVACARGGVIGADGRMPWHEPEDLRHFKAATLGHAVIMGRTTWTSIGRPLPGRRNLVLSRTPGLALPGAEVFASLEAAIAAARAGGDGEPRVIGGAQVYAQALPLATLLLLTEIDLAVAGDALFPDPGPGWRESARTVSGRLTFRTLVRP